jgi:Carboxypeptidase regulatory-like domain
MRCAKWIVFLIVICFGAVLEMSAQSTSTGTVAGVVTDQSGAVVGGASVTITDTATNTARSTVSNDAGRYIFVNVVPSTYELRISKQGFSEAKVLGQTVEVGKTLTLNLAMKVGSANEVVEVQATGTELQVMNATVGNTVNGVSLESLPSLGRDVSTFITMQPGISPDGSVAGTAVDQSYFSLDGGNNSNDMDGSMSVYTPSYSGDITGGVANQSFGVAAGPTGVMPTPADSVEEFKVNTANQTADFNSSSGAEVKVVTKRGTNYWHGSAYEYYLDNNFSGNTWDNNFNRIPAPEFHYNRFGVSIGGPIIPTEILGGKTYFFANYQGFRWPNATTVSKIVPSANMRNGILTDPTTGQLFDLKTLDPRGIGIDPTVQQLWKFEPNSNAACSGAVPLCDGVNVQAFSGNLSIPQNDNFGVMRLDHDFSAKWHFMSSFRYYHLTRATPDQVDIGGFFKGDTLGVPASVSSNPQVPWYLVAGVTTNITSNTTNDFHYSYLRNWWAWGRAGDTVQLPGLGGALEPFGESRDDVLAPYNVNTQQTRTRFWDGKDQMFRDDLSMLKGNHLFQFGGIYQHNFNWHQRTDNGGGINYQPVYQLGTASGPGTGVNISAPASWTGSATDWGRDYAAVLGIVSASQIAYTRSGPNLALNPPLTPAFDQSTIPYYNTYFSDSWHMKPTFTLTYGLGWTLEMPPVESSGKQVVLVDQANQIVDVQSYLRSREQAALQGQVYNPLLGFTLVGNSEDGRKYPYDPFYGEFSPRVAAAWNPHFDGDSLAGKVFGREDTVIRGGYGRVYGRLNGVNLVLVPLLGVGLIQPVQCFAPTISGTCGSSNPTNAFRVGIDGLTAPLAAATPTLPQPDFPGVNNTFAGAVSTLDPHFRPNVVDSFDFTIQRQLARKVTLELGYIGRRITHEYQPININAVPYMMTLGGQSFSKAYANMTLQYCGGVSGMAGGNCAGNAGAVTAQPFFETALKGTGYCNGFANCTQAVIANEGSAGTHNLNIQNVWSLWSDLDAGILGNGTSLGHDGFNFPRSMMNTPINCTTGIEIGCNGQLSSGVAINSSIGYGNYNAGFATLKMSDWKGLTMQSNFTWSKALGTGTVVQSSSADTAPDPFDLGLGYGRQAFDRRFVYTLFVVYQPPFFKSQKGVAGHMLGGWTFAPIFSAGSGQPLVVGSANGGGQSFGEADGIGFTANGVPAPFGENAIPIGPLNQGNSAHYNVPGSNGVGNGGLPINEFANPAAVFANFRDPILGYDTKDEGWGVLTGLPYWNMDLSIRKAVPITERVGLEFQVVFTNVLNHAQLLDPVGTSLAIPSIFGVLPGEGNGLNNASSYTPRSMEFGFRVRF